MAQELQSLPDAPALETLEIDPQRRRRGLRALGVAVGAIGFSMALQMGLNANFLANDVGISGYQLGMLEAIRESCGITAFLLIGLLAGLAEPLLGAAMLVLFAAGIGGYAFVPTYGWVILMSLVWSQGLHVWMPLPNSMALALAEPGRTGHRLGQLGSAGALGFGLGLGTALVLTLAGVPIRPMYLLAGAMALVAAGACLMIPRNIRAPGVRLAFRRKYGLYYLLCLLEGWRKQIFVAFAAYLLVQQFNTPLWVILGLMALVQGIGFVAAPHVGRLIDRVGERPVLVFYYSCLTLSFIGYALVRNPYMLYGLFVLDNAFFVFALALTTYVNRIAPPNEHTATLSMGVAMNHVAAVTMPLVGGLLWLHMGYAYTFLIGAVAAGLSVFITALLVPGRRVGSSIV